MKKKISIIIPFYNQASQITPFCKKITAALNVVPTYDYEIIIVNDGSTDDSWYHISKIALGNNHIKGINLSRHFGYQAALRAGFDTTCTDAIISINPQRIGSSTFLPKMIDQWEHGFEIVTVGSNENSFLIDKKVHSTIQNSKKNYSVPEIITFHQFKKINIIDFQKSKIILKNFQPKNFLKYLNKRGLVHLKFFFSIGLGMIALGSGIVMFIIITTLFFAINYSLHLWLVSILCIFTGIQSLMLWLIGEYLIRINEQDNGIPLYEIKEIINFKIFNETYMPPETIEQMM